MEDQPTMKAESCLVKLLKKEIVFPNNSVSFRHTGMSLTLNHDMSLIYMICQYVLFVLAINLSKDPQKQLRGSATPTNVDISCPLFLSNIVIQCRQQMVQMAFCDYSHNHQT